MLLLIVYYSILKKKEQFISLIILSFYTQALLFNPSKPFARSGNYLDVDLMIEYLVSCFRIKPHNNEALKICLYLNSPPAYHFVIVSTLYK